MERKDTASKLAKGIAEVFVSTFKELNTEAYVHIVMEDGTCSKIVLNKEGRLTAIRPTTLRDYLHETRTNGEDPRMRTYRT